MFILHPDISDENKLDWLGQKIGQIKLLNENAQFILIGNNNNSMAHEINQVLFKQTKTLILNEFFFY